MTIEKLVRNGRMLFAGLAAAATLSACGVHKDGCNYIEYQADRSNNFQDFGPRDCSAESNGAGSDDGNGTDDGGNSNHPPEISDIGNKTFYEGEEFNLSFSVTDSDGDPLILSLEGPDWASINYEPGAETGNVSGTAPDVPASTDYQITTTVSDGEMTSSTSSTLTVTDVTPENQPPTATVTRTFPNKGLDHLVEYNIFAEDEDGVDYATVSYNGNESQTFTSSEGNLIVNYSADVEEEGELTVNVCDTLGMCTNKIDNYVIASEDEAEDVIADYLISNGISYQQNVQFTIAAPEECQDNFMVDFYANVNGDQVIYDYESIGENNNDKWSKLECAGEIYFPISKVPRENISDILEE